MALSTTRIGLLLAAMASWMIGPSHAQPAPKPQPQEGAMKAPELAPNLGWLNTDKPLRFSDELKGHVVVLDFWTYCCINCMNVIPDLENIEKKYADQPVIVIGVHSAKFFNEAERESIRNATKRYRVTHPVVVDNQMDIWQRFAVRGWPSILVVGADGRLIEGRSGEGNGKWLDDTVAAALEKAKAAGTLAKEKLKLALEGSVASPTGLSFPGKVLAVAPVESDRGWLFISDSTNNRVIAASLPDENGKSTLRFIAGGPDAGFADGDIKDARFHDPQGLAWDPDSKTLYVADHSNHSVRALKVLSGIAGWTARVSTLIGNGEQSRDRRGGRTGPGQGLNAPWDVALSPDRKTLYIANAGSHQIWTADIESRRAEVLAGTGGENRIDGSFEQALLAQPSGLAVSPDGQTIYVADSEVSAVRVLSLKDRAVTTLVGRGLFVFGDKDGEAQNARFQHPLGVALFPAAEGGGADKLLVADTYNHKIKLLTTNPATVSNFVGVSRTVDAAGVLRLDEPGGLSIAAGRIFIADTNNHRIVVVENAGESWMDRPWREVMIDGLAAPATEQPAGTAVTAPAAPGKPLELSVTLTLPAGEHPNPEAPTTLRVTAAGGRVVAQSTTRAAEFPVKVTIPAADVKPGATLRVELASASCSTDRGICTPREGVWTLTVADGTETKVELTAGIR